MSFAWVVTLVWGILAVFTGFSSSDITYFCQDIPQRVPRSAPQILLPPSQERISRVQQAVENKDSQEALGLARQCALDFREDATAHGLYSCALFRVGQFTEARREADRALSLDANDYQGLVASARIFHWENNYRQALTLLNKATTLAPKQSAAWRCLYRVLQDDQPETDGDRAQWQDLYQRLRKLTSTATANPDYLNLVPINPDGSLLTHVDRSKAIPQSVTLPYQRSKLGLLSIPVTIHGQKFRFVFDTGWSGLTLNKSAAKSLDLKYSGKQKISTMFGIFTGDVTLLDEVAFDTLAVHNVLTVTNSLSNDIGEADGILGADLFQRCVITIDSLKSTITFTPVTATKLASPLPHRKQTAHGASTLGQETPLDSGSEEGLSHRIHFSYFQKKIYFPALVGDRPVMAHLDTGANGEVISRRLADKILQDPVDPKTPDKARREVGIFLFTGREVTITLDHAVPVCAFAEPDIVGDSFVDEVSRSQGLDIGLFLGVPFVEAFAEMKIDFPNRELTLTQRGAKQ